MIQGIGVDLESVGPFREKVLEKHPKFYDRLFSEKELAYCRKYSDPYPHLAARFCAKEAMVKAASFNGAFFITDFEVDFLPGGAPTVLPRKMKKSLRDFFVTHECHLSLSHTKDLATAFVVVTMRPV